MGTVRVVVYGPSTSRVCKVLWALREASLPISVERDMRRPAELRAEQSYLALNPKGTVPTAVFSYGEDNGSADLVLNESNTIVSYVAQRFAPALYPSTPESLALAWQWMEWGESSAAVPVSAIWFGLVRGGGYPPLPDAKLSIERDDSGTAMVVNGVPTRKLLEVWSVLEHELQRGNGAFMQGGNLTIADITVGVLAARVFALPTDQLGFSPVETFPSAYKWYCRLLERDAYREMVLPCAGATP
mmetsp:Transcript_17377/g.44931  ORF Transcript_17377/g.44931 Transcript_17377/m.44931 type:complete len:244 (+) Transcript_17377:113-844(+)